MEDDAVERRVAIVAVTAPGGQQEVHFDVASAGEFIAKLDDGIAEIRSRFAIPEARMKNTHRAAVQRSERVGPDALVPPDLLEESLAGNSVFCLVQKASAEGLRAPGGVRLERTDEHLPLHFT